MLIWIVLVSVVGSFIINWGYWIDALKIPVITVTLAVIGYVFTWKLWRIEITPKGEIFSRAGFTTDFRLKVADIVALEQGTHYFPAPQPVLMVKYHSETGANSVMIRPVAWGDRVLGQVIRDLLKLNPSIVLDDYAKAMLAQADA